MGIRIVKSTERGLIEKHKRFYKFVKPGFHWINPVIERLYLVNTSEQMVDTLFQHIITKDNMKVMVDAQVHFKVKTDEESVIKIIYNLENYKMCIINLARVSLRNLIGSLTSEVAHSKRGKINTDLCESLKYKTIDKGIEVISTELIEFDKPVFN